MFDFSKVRRKCIIETKKNIAESVNNDFLLIQAVSAVEEIDKIINKVITRLREWYSLYNPEFSRSLKNNEKFVELILSKKRNQLLREIKVSATMGGELSKRDIDAIMHLAKESKGLINAREKEKEYIENVLTEYCPNGFSVLGGLCGKFIRHAGSLRRLATSPATVIQIMGAEKSMFKHLRKKGKCPKYGILYAHPLISKVNGKNRGKMARAIADKAAMAFKIDFFKGKFIGKGLRDELEKKAKKLM